MTNLGYDDLYPTIYLHSRERMLSAASCGGARILARQTGAAVAGSRREFSLSGVSSAPIQTVTVVGSGLMGSGIAQVSLYNVMYIKFWGTVCLGYTFHFMQDSGVTV